MQVAGSAEFPRLPGSRSKRAEHSFHVGPPPEAGVVQRLGQPSMADSPPRTSMCALDNPRSVRRPSRCACCRFGYRQADCFGVVLVLLLFFAVASRSPQLREEPEGTGLCRVGLSRPWMAGGPESDTDV